MGNYVDFILSAEKYVARVWGVWTWEKCLGSSFFSLSLSLLLPSYDDPSRVGCYKVRASVGYILKISSQVWYGGLLGFKLIYIFFI